MSSCMPSVKNALSFSSLMLANGRTAMDLSSFAKATEDAVGDTAAAGGCAGGAGGWLWFRLLTATAVAIATTTAVRPPQVHAGTPFFRVAPAG